MSETRKTGRLSEEKSQSALPGKKEETGHSFTRTVRLPRVKKKKTKGD